MFDPRTGLAARGAGGLLLLISFCAASRLPAVIIPVTTTADDVTTNGNCTLREALSSAAYDTPADACPVGSPMQVDAVELPAGNYAWTLGAMNITNGQFILRGPAAAPPTATVNLGALTRFLRIYNGSEVRIENLTLLNGSATLDGQSPLGGQLWVSDSDLALLNVELIGGYARGGGALYFEGASADGLFIDRCRFYLNNAEVADTGTANGGALLAVLGEGTHLILLDSEFDSNAAGATSNSLWAFGGAAHLSATATSSVEVLRTTFAGNRALPAPGGLGGAGALMMLGSGNANAALFDLSFSANFVGASIVGVRASALDLSVQNAAVAFLDRLRFLANGDTDAGTHVRLAGYDTSTIEAANVLVAQGPYLGVDAVAWNESTIRLGHVTAGEHDGIGIQLEAHDSGELRLENSLAWGSTIDVWDTVPSSVDPSTLAGVDPLFVEPAAGDYRLGSGSTAIDHGDSILTTVHGYDLAHAPRVIGLDTDAGAYEYSGVFADGFESGDRSAWSSSVP